MFWNVSYLDESGNVKIIKGELRKHWNVRLFALGKITTALADYERYSKIYVQKSKLSLQCLSHCLKVILRIQEYAHIFLVKKHISKVNAACIRLHLRA